MSNLGKIVYLTEAQLATLVSDGSITVDDKTVTYSENDIYMTPSQPNIPAGGNTGQSLVKLSSNDYDVGWANNALPVVSSSDNGKFLRVVNGAWNVASISMASGVSF